MSLKKKKNMKENTKSYSSVQKLKGPDDPSNEIAFDQLVQKQKNEPFLLEHLENN